MKLSEVYRAFGEDSEAGAQARLLLDQQHWYASIAEFDPKTGEALPLGFDEVVRRIADRSESTEIRDRLWRIVDHCRLALEHIFAALSENPRREQAYLPIRDVKELNATSFIALSRRPGRNIREKLADKPYMQAVRRYQSVDLPQNRLVKEFVTRLGELLELRGRYLEQEDDLQGDIYRWLRSDDAQLIGRWHNLPPNNTLLSHRDYRRVWDAWRWLQVLDETMDNDLSQLEARAATVAKWDAFGKAYTEGRTLFGDMPVLFDYDAFAIEPWSTPIARDGSARNRPVHDSAPADIPACVDLTYVRPRYASMRSTVTVSQEPYLWQRWKSGSDSVDLELFNADIAVLHLDATTVSCADLFFSKDLDSSQLDWAAHAFARHLSKSFANPTLVWLFPDFLNDFQLQVARRNLNAWFAQAQPLPRSVAAVFEQVEHSMIKAEGFQVVIVDAAGGTTYATKLIARHDHELEHRVPETQGFYWERSPYVTLDHDGEAYDPLAEVPRVDSEGRWNDQGPVVGLQRVSQEALRRHPQIGEFDIAITILESPVSGGVRLHELQERAGDIPLWRDHIPELSIKVFRDRRYEPFFLVDRDTTIRPIRGVAVPIPVFERFTLPAGKAYFQFPLFQGQDSDDLGYVARLDSPAFPLATDTVCRLAMTYTYGADDPYRLVFEPDDSSFKSIQVKWRPKAEEIITDAPAPGYPTPLTWDELQRHYNAAKQSETDYLDWAVRQTEKHLETLGSISNPRYGVVKTEWKENGKGKQFLFVEQDDDDDVYVGEFDLARSTSLKDVRRGDEVHFLLVYKGDRVFARHVAPTKVAMINDIASAMQRGLYVPYIKTWADARAMQDADCPTAFRTRMASTVPRLEQIWMDRSTPNQMRNELRFILSCMHRDMPSSVARDLVAGATAKFLDERTYAFALGDLSQDWQRDIFRSILSRADVHMLGVLSQAIWRTASFVRMFDEASLDWLSEFLLQAMRDANAGTHPRKEEVSRVTQYCELLLGLLRSRDSEADDVRLMLQPHQERTKLLADQVELAVGLVERSGLAMRSRVTIADLPDKPRGDETPDLLYALRLYLTGDVGANAIRVTGVVDGEDD